MFTPYAPEGLTNTLFIITRPFTTDFGDVIHIRTRKFIVKYDLSDNLLVYMPTVQQL